MEEPSPSDLRLIRIMRLPLEGVLALPPWESFPVPSEYLVVNDTVRAQAEGLEAVESSTLWESFR